MKRDSKAHQSDDEGEDDQITQDNQVATTALSKEEIERRNLENLPVIADSEISPAAYLFQNQDEQEDIQLFESQSMKVKCPFCDSVSFSIVEYRTSFLGYLVAILSILIFGIMSIILMPFLVNLTKVALHRCAKCLNEVKSNSYFGFSSLEDRLLTFQLGKFGIVLTRRYLMYIAGTITCFLAIYLFVVSEAGHSHDERPLTDLQWNDFRRDCGYYAYLASPSKAQDRFERTYYNRGVTWDGYIIRVNLNEEDTLNFAYHSSSIMIKMNPADQDGAHGADLGISLSERMLARYKDEIDKLHRGDHVRFNATLLSMGDSQHLHHLHGFGIQKIEGHIDVDAHLHSGGRYKFKQTPHTHDQAPANDNNDPQDNSVSSE